MKVSLVLQKNPKKDQNQSQNMPLAQIDSVRMAMLEVKCSKLELLNKNLIKDTNVLKKLLNESKSVILYKDIQLERLNNYIQLRGMKLTLFERYEDKFTGMLIITGIFLLKINETY